MGSRVIPISRCGCFQAWSSCVCVELGKAAAALTADHPAQECSRYEQSEQTDGQTDRRTDKKNGRERPNQTTCSCHKACTPEWAIERARAASNLPAWRAEWRRRYQQTVLQVPDIDTGVQGGREQDATVARRGESVHCTKVSP